MYAEKRVQSKNNKFLKLTSEKEDINQYWFSETTIEFLINQIKKSKADKIAFVSTPSIFFSSEEDIKEKGYVFDYDERLVKKHKHGVKFDFNEFSELIKDEKFKNNFDFILIDPPYINEPSWTKYSEFIKAIAKCTEGKITAKILTCSIAENKEMLKRLLDLELKKFQPSIPHLVYQYNFFANYDDEDLDKLNPEILADI
jgi:hypothetical protein